jgi:hypothetical protein
MVYLLYISNLLRAYYMVRAAHGVYVSFIFLQWVVVNIYSGLVWIFYYIPKPYLQIKGKELYYEIDEGDYINIIEKD